MSRVITEIEINAPVDRVWSVVADLSAIENYHPAVPKSYYTSEIKEGVNASRHCDILPSSTVEERVIDWKDGKEYTLDIYEGSMPAMKMLKLFTGKTGVEPHGEGTQVSQTLEYKVKGGPLGAMLGFLMKRPMGKRNADALIGLKHFIETGEVVTPQVFKKVKKTEHAAHG